MLWFDKPDRVRIERFLRLKFKNVATDFNPAAHAGALEGYSYAEMGRICIQAMKAMVIARKKRVALPDFTGAVQDEYRSRTRAGARS